MLAAPRFSKGSEQAAIALIANIAARAKAVDDRETEVENELLDKLEIWQARTVSAYWNDGKSKQSLLQVAEPLPHKRHLGRNQAMRGPQ